MDKRSQVRRAAARTRRPPNPSNPTQQLFTGTWEIITGSVAYSAPAGPTLAQLGLSTGALTPEQFAFYGTLPNAAKALALL